MSLHYLRSQPEPPAELTGERIVLRPWRSTDAPELFAAVDESRERLRAWMTWVDGHRTLTDSQNYCERVAVNWANRSDLALAICDRETGSILGGTGFHNIDWGVPSFDIGYWVREGEEGKGYIAEAVRLQTRHAFERFDAMRVVITCDPANERSSAIPRRLGYVLEGHLRNHIRMTDNELRDTLIFAMTPDDYAKRAERGGW